MVVLITGVKGQLGNELTSIINSGKSEISEVSNEIKEIEIIAMDIDTLDITDIVAVKKAIKDIKPDVVINCAAYTNVDACETDSDMAFKVNAIGPRNLAIATEEIGAKLVQVSTDYVFSGKGETPFKEYDIASPYSVYGKTKLMGEEFVRELSSKYFIIRTAWLYGYVGNNFVYTIMKLAKERESINVVNDQIGNPTNANDLAHHILKLISTEEYGVYHCTGKGECSWYDFAKEIVDLAGIDCVVNPCTSEEFVRAAKRPEYSSLDNMMLRCTIGDEMRDWKVALKTFMNKVK